jgi:hypothetical protein
LSTTWAFLHFHQVALTQTQLAAVAGGGAVRVETGAHTFSIQLTVEHLRPGAFHG